MEILILCIKIFLVRILDVSLGTIRTIITVKSKALIASIVGFFEVLVWFLIVKEALNTTNNSIFIAISYSIGFATGTYIGSKLSDRFIKGTLSIQIVTNKVQIIDFLRKQGYAVSVIDISEIDDKIKKYMLVMEINKKDLNEIKSLIRHIDNKAFLVVNESKYVFNGYFKTK